MRKIETELLEESFFKKGNPLKKLLNISLDLLGAEQTGILYGTNHTKIKFLPTTMWDRGVMDRFDGRGLKGLLLKYFGTKIVTARKLSPVFFYKKNEIEEKVNNDGIIAHVLRNCADYYKSGISILICPNIVNYVQDIEEDYVYIPFFSYDGVNFKLPDQRIKLDVKIVKHFNAVNYISIYLPSYGILVANTVDGSLLENDGETFTNETELKKRLDLLIKLVEASSLAFLGRLKGKKGAELLWRKERQLRTTSTKLAENETKYRDLYENAPIAYFSMDVDGIIFRCNENACRLSGYENNDLIGKRVLDLLGNKVDMIDATSQIQEKIRNNAPIKDLELQINHSSGKKIWISLSIDPIKDKTNKIVELRAIAIDINQRKVLERRLIQAQKMEAIGTLAGGIAHDFNNLLSPVSGYAELLLMDAKECNYNTKNIEVILNCTKHAKSLVNQMLTFSKQKEPQYKLIQVSDSVIGTLDLVRSFLPATIEIKTDINKDCGIIKADPVQIHQVIMNLITNAFHAMEYKNGILKITLKEIFLKEDEKSELPIPGPYVLLKIEDTGSGIDKKSLNNIFDPYFTTKKEGKGTGLGLSVVHGIVLKHNGHIEVESQKGEGSVFRIYLPIFQGDIEMNEHLEKDVIIRLGTENILLVDDDENVAEMETQMLEKLGYRVICHTDSLKALKAFKEKPDYFDVVVSDMTMPKMTGLQLAQKLHSINSATPIILCTGFGDHIDKKQFDNFGIKGLLNKPVEIMDFSSTLRRIIDSNK